MKRSVLTACLPLVLGALVLLLPRAAGAFCGFYVAGADGALYNNATQVVLMRSGKTTVLSMQNNYKGPPKDFAMVVPVPEILSEDNVKTLPPEVFARVDLLAAPRLVEYWEQDPCSPAEHLQVGTIGKGRRMSARGAAPMEESEDLGVTVEAQFEVGEYEVVILSAKFSTGLEEWLHQEKYVIPAGAETYLRPYVQSGSKFFVAKVNADKVKFVDGNATLSPLRFHYQSDSFDLPVRLGLMNAEGKQDLIVHILAENKRYEVANYPNVTIPTNLAVAEDARNRFGEFYAALFDSTLEKNPRAVVTEYSWSAASCDPCPSPPLSWSELQTLGYDVVGPDAAPAPTAAPGRSSRSRRISGSPGSFVLTRLHARYDKSNLGEDLIFKEAEAIAGGREFLGSDKQLETGAVKNYVNNFQGRYAIRHEWKGPIDCPAPQRGIWGGPPSGTSQPSPTAATDLAFAARGKIHLASMVPAGIPELGVAGKAAPIYASDDVRPVPTEPTVPNPRPRTTVGANQGDGSTNVSSKGCSAGGQGSTAGGLLLVVGLLFLRRRRACRA